MAEPKTLLFITTELPWPADSGGRIKTFRLVEFLSQHYRVRLLCAQGGRKKKAMRQLREHVQLESVQAFNNFKPRTAFNWFRALMSFPSFNAYRNYSLPMESMIKASAEAADIVLMDHLEIVEMIPEKFNGTLIYHSHNAEFKMWEQYAAFGSNPLKRWVVEWEASRVKVLERYAIRKAQLTFASPNDQEALIQELKLDPAKFRLTYHLGNDGLLELPAIDLEANSDRLFYAGTLSWEPNREGLTWFLREVWPDVRARVSNATITVCGKGADPDLERILHETEGVDYKGFVPDLDTEMKQCRLAIVPMRFGSGMNIKTFDALYRGLPLVTTSTGAEGIELEHERHVLIQDEAKGFSSAVATLLTDPKKGAELAAAGRKLASEKYTYAALFKQMLQSLQELETETE